LVHPFASNAARHSSCTRIADKVVNGELTFDDAYRLLWADGNVRAVHRGCNYGRNKKEKR
jgi:hypothetical protein